MDKALISGCQCYQNELRYPLDSELFSEQHYTDLKFDQQNTFESLAYKHGT